MDLVAEKGQGEKVRCVECGREIKEEEDWVWFSGKGFLCIECFKKR